MEYKGKRSIKFSDVFLVLSWFILAGIIGSTEQGSSLWNILWVIPIFIVDMIIVAVDYF